MLREQHTEKGESILHFEGASFIEIFIDKINWTLKLS